MSAVERTALERSAAAPLGQALESPVSAVTWSAVFAGAVVASATSLILVALGSGLGWASISPWPGHGASLGTISALTGVWLIITQWIATGIGAYLTGRLRTKWVNAHTHEIFFRDTAHGFITWALATLALMLLLALLGTIAATGVGAAGAAAASQTAARAAPDGYDVDLLFRSDHPDANPAELRTETGRILGKAFASGDVDSSDRAYLAQLVAARTGLSASDSQQRVNDVVAKVQDSAAKAKKAADEARKASSAAAFFTALSLVIGAFIGCVAAALGGSRRDEYA